MYGIKDLFGILVIGSVNVINYVVFVSICKCRKKSVDKLVEECTKNVLEVKLAKITLSEDENKLKCSSFTLDIAFFSINFTINAGIGIYKYMNHVKKTAAKGSFNYQITFDY